MNGSSNLSEGDSSSIIISLDLLVVNDFTILVKLVLLMSSATILLLGIESIVREKLYDYEFPVLILLSTLGMMLLVSSTDMIMLYLSIELISLSLYVLSGINKKSQHSTEAGLKYFLLGALSSGLLLFGMALVYAFTGATSFVAISEFL
jgi:NADH-quinone oxidoreductase subunit N